MRNALVIVIVCLSVSLLYDVYKEPIDRLLHLDQTETNETTETGNRKQKTKKQAQKPDGQTKTVKEQTAKLKKQKQEMRD